MNMNSSNFNTNAGTDANGNAGADQTKPQIQINGQEVVFYNIDDDDDVEADPTNNTNTSNIPDDKSGVAATARRDAPIPTNIKRGFTLTTKNMVCGIALLCSVGAAGIAVGMGIAGFTEISTAANHQAQKMELNGAGKSGKTSKSQGPPDEDFYECIVEPIMALGAGPPDDLTPKKFKKELWKPYVKRCENFWSYLAYVFTVMSGSGPFFSFSETITALAESIHAMTEENADNGCTALMKDFSSGSPVVYLATLNEANTAEFWGNIQDCANELAGEGSFDAIMDQLLN